MKVTVHEFASRRKLLLDRDQTYLFAQELRRIKKRFPAVKGLPYGMGPDCLITVADKKRRHHYSLHGHAILFEKHSNKRWQFYFGVLLLQWLYK